jgi:signal transduction histidine kinase
MVDDNLEADVAAIARIAAVPTILDVVCRTTGMGFAAVARVTSERWIACEVRDNIAFGLRPGGELNVETTICHEVRQTREPVIINHVAEDVAYCGHPTPAMYGFESYISMPIVLPDGSFFGTLCAIDPRPARLNTPETIGMFKLFAELIAFHLGSLDRLAASETSLLSERETSALREQFIAVLGHDLRNPLASIDAGVRLLERTSLDAKASRVVAMIHGSVARMAGLIDNVPDFARGRLGGGLSLERDVDASLQPVLTQIVAEIRASWPDRAIETDFALGAPVNCDSRRIGQLFSNLLGNALAHGAADTPIRASAISDRETFELSVANRGTPISPDALERLFQPFTRGAIRPSQQGLGLGLYICAEIAQAHGGRLDVVSSAEETRFTFRMPA